MLRSSARYFQNFREEDVRVVLIHSRDQILPEISSVLREFARKKMEKAFAFMLRVRVPGGVLSTAQWLALDRLARDYGNQTLRLTTRQTVQLHGVIKSNLKSTLQEMDSVLLRTIAACGDVNRNVMCNPNPHQSRAHGAAIDLARAISDHLTPRTPAYREVWLDGERIIGGEDDVVEPIYGKTYLPRKFKIAIAVPPSNDVDVFAHDLGFIGADIDETYLAEAAERTWSAVLDRAAADKRPAKARRAELKAGKATAS